MFLAAAAVVLLTVVGLIVLFFTPVFGVRTVRVVGARTVSADTVRSSAAIADGTPLVRVDTSAARARVLHLPGVAGASVHVAYPSTVVITIEERTAVGYIRDSAARFSLVDSHGVEYRVESKVPAALPRFDLPTGTAAASTLSSAAAVAAALPVDVRAKVVTISADTPDSIRLVLSDDRVVIWGDASQSALKGRLLPPLLTRSGHTIDVSDPALVVVG
ncbi:MAG: FtsQ-type POTRA domain-containing protein [Actinobacteria bacterium]|nr:FtsQ-type POTRA domain-containing protein [Actinomycetota bacterium]